LTARPPTVPKPGLGGMKSTSDCKKVLVVGLRRPRPGGALRAGRWWLEDTPTDHAREGGRLAGLGVGFDAISVAYSKPFSRLAPTLSFTIRPGFGQSTPPRDGQAGRCAASEIWPLCVASLSGFLGPTLLPWRRGASRSGRHRSGSCRYAAACVVETIGGRACTKTATPPFCWETSGRARAARPRNKTPSLVAACTCRRPTPARPGRRRLIRPGRRRGR
jgi:hypothetical protein